MNRIMLDRSKRIELLRMEAGERILIMDGAMGTALQAYKLDEDQFRGERLKSHNSDLKGNNDILCLTQPDILREIHAAYLDAGADIICTNTFNGTSISQAEYGLGAMAYDVSFAGARLAREAADAVARVDRPRFVAGSMGPTNKTLSISPDISRPEYRAVTFESVVEAYKESARGLLDGGADYLLLETIFDTLNAKAAIVGIDELADELGKYIPLALSVTVTDLSGRTLSGQTVEAFWHSVRHANPVTIGLNCSFGAQDLRPFVREMSKIAPTLLCAYPNAGLPDEMGDYTETPDVTSDELQEWATSGFLNVVGGCCGTTPAHIAAIARAVEGIAPRQIPDEATAMRLSGLEPLTVVP
jgi:5-methyltetrahydrofolate--homocysteine methyltransferase